MVRDNHGSDPWCIDLKERILKGGSVGAPHVIVRDNGPCIRSITFKDMCFGWGIKLVTTSPYHLGTNNFERFNRYLEIALTKFQNWELNHLNLDIWDISSLLEDIDVVSHEDRDRHAHDHLRSASKRVFRNSYDDLCNVKVHGTYNHQLWVYKVSAHDSLNRQKKKTPATLGGKTIDLKGSRTRTVKHHGDSLTVKMLLEVLCCESDSSRTIPRIGDSDDSDTDDQFLLSYVRRHYSMSGWVRASQTTVVTSRLSEQGFGTSIAPTRVDDSTAVLFSALIPALQVVSHPSKRVRFIQGFVRDRNDDLSHVRNVHRGPVLHAQALNLVPHVTVVVLLDHLPNRMDFAATVGFVYRVPRDLPSLPRPIFLPDVPEDRIGQRSWWRPLRTVPSRRSFERPLDGGSYELRTMIDFRLCSKARDFNTNRLLIPLEKTKSRTSRRQPGLEGKCVGVGGPEATILCRSMTSWSNLPRAHIILEPLSVEGATACSFSTGSSLFGCTAMRDQVEDDVLYDQVATVTPRRLLDHPPETRLKVPWVQSRNALECLGLTAHWRKIIPVALVLKLESLSPSVPQRHPRASGLHLAHPSSLLGPWKHANSLPPARTCTWDSPATPRSELLSSADTSGEIISPPGTAPLVVTNTEPTPRVSATIPLHMPKPQTVLALKRAAWRLVLLHLEVEHAQD
uniref:Integrase catalytic domain-containing protein n=1 Tax=Timema shepardi TaxID=629360 RepID=A0A7R9G2G5_TIMSH|nr:unnamed protein product [Timema shepardi]